jgi:hypothetical protein
MHDHVSLFLRDFHQDIQFIPMGLEKRLDRASFALARSVSLVWSLTVFTSAGLRAAFPFRTDSGALRRSTR